MLDVFEALRTVAAESRQDFNEQELAIIGSHMVDAFEALRAVAAESLQDLAIFGPHMLDVQTLAGQCTGDTRSSWHMLKLACGRYCNPVA